MQQNTIYTYIYFTLVGQARQNLAKSPYNQRVYFLLTLCWSAVESQMKKYQCIVCGWIYDEAQGWPEDGIVAGTLWDDIPEDWTCPDCGVSKADFEMVEL